MENCLHLFGKEEYRLDYIEFFAPDCQLHPNLFNPKIENGNSRQVKEERLIRNID